jgi:hypothetical protein
MVLYGLLTHRRVFLQLQVPTYTSINMFTDLYLFHLSAYIVTFTYCKFYWTLLQGIVPIVVAWFFAPIATGVCSSSVFMITRSLVLRSEHSYERSFFVLPLYVVITLWINIYFVFTKGAKKTLVQGDWSDDKAAWVAFVIAAGLGIMSFALLPLVRRRAEFLDNEENERNLARESR